MADILISISGGSAVLVRAPAGTTVEIRDYDVPDEYDQDNQSCKLDDQGDRYQEIMLP